MHLVNMGDIQNGYYQEIARRLSLILVLATYVNLAKPLIGIRYFPIFIDFLIFILFFKIILTKILHKQLFLVKSIEIPLYIFFFISLIQLINSNVPSLTIGFEGFRKTTFQMLAVFIGIYFIENKEQIQKILKTLAWFSIPVLLYGLKQFFLFSSFDLKIIELNAASIWTHKYGGIYRSISIFSGPFHFGMFSCIIALIFLYFYLKIKKFSYLFLSIVSIMGVFLSMTRTNIVALIISYLFFLWFIKPEKQRFFKKINVLFIIFLLIISIISIKKFFPITYVLKSFENISEDQRLLVRFVGYRKMTKAFIESPIIGYGMGSAGDTLGPLFEGKTHFTSHNLGFKIFIETGLAGLGVYIFFFLAWFNKAFNLFKIKDSNIKNLSVLITSIVLILLINGLVGSPVGAYPINLYVWFFMGALVKISWIEKKAKWNKYNEQG